MTFLYFVLAGLALGILVFIHELGHYFVARRMKMTVEVFSIGFGKPLIKWRFQNVDWQLGWLPFGGYVKILGMEVSKKEQREPYDIPGGFFSKSPLKRIAVAIAGPLANFFLAFLVFALIWLMGGREKPFSEFTQIVGYVEPHSEAYAKGIRPGDLLTAYNGQAFTHAKDLLYAAMLGGEEVELSGYHVNYQTKEKTPYSYHVKTYAAPGALDDMKTTGVTTMAHYLIYDQLPSGGANPLLEDSPMAGSGLTYGDRLVWADGRLLFSMEQLSELINEPVALVTVKRGEDVLLLRSLRVKAGELQLPVALIDELTDWQYELNLKKKWTDIYILPYLIGPNRIVKKGLTFIDASSSFASQEELQPGDQILAIDGERVTKSVDMVRKLQTHHVLFICERGVSAFKKIPWKKEDAIFEDSMQVADIQLLASTIGTTDGIRAKGRYALLHPVEPKQFAQFNLSPDARQRAELEMMKQKEEVMRIKDRERREEALKYLDKVQSKYLLGIYLQDEKVDYNPGPFALFGQVFVETWHTLKALIQGYLHPKWLSGPIGIVRVIHYGWQMGVKEALFWIGAISVNLGFLNLLPIPVLDGGYICLSLWEMITRRRLKAKTMEKIVIPFVVLLIALLVFLTFQDISRLFS